jgi:hypothetical protein
VCLLQVRVEVISFLCFRFMSAASGCISKFNYGSIFIVIKTNELEHVSAFILCLVKL